MSEVVIKGTTPGPCGCCAAPVPGFCGCALFIPLFATSDPVTGYVNYAAAAAAVASHTASCIGFFDNPAVPASFTANNATPNRIVFSVNVNGTNNAPMWACVTIAAGGTITIPWSATMTTSPSVTAANAVLIDCATGLDVAFDSNSGTSGTLVLSGMAAGTYYLKVVFGGDGTSPKNITATFTCTSNVAMIANPVIALWNDGGTMRQLEACPKMQLPPIGGSWYASCADAAAVLADPLKVSNCVGYSENNIAAPFTSFTATGGGSLSLKAAAFTTPSANTGPMWGSINAQAGASITATTDGFFVQLTVFDDAGNVVSSQFAFATSVTSPPLLYPGRYTIQVISAGNPFVTTSITVTVSSSSAMTTNDVQALYDVGLPCPARLDCGDPCP